MIQIQQTALLCNFLSLGKCPVLHSFCGFLSGGLFVGNTFNRAKDTGIQHVATLPGQFLQYPQDRGVDLQRMDTSSQLYLSMINQSLKVHWCTSALDFPSEGDLKKLCLFVFLEKKKTLCFFDSLPLFTQVYMLWTPGTSSVMSSVSCHCFPTGE